MGQPKLRTDSPQIFHVNFHTNGNRPMFEVPEYDTLLRRELTHVIARWGIATLAWQTMPTHVHIIIVSFPDQPLGKIVNLTKGATSRAILLAFSDLRGDLGNHLWQQGYDWVEITSQRQCANAIRYVQENRVRGGLEP